MLTRQCFYQASSSQAELDGRSGHLHMFFYAWFLATVLHCIEKSPFATHTFYSVLYALIAKAGDVPIII